MHDILRALPEDAMVALSVGGEKATVRCAVAAAPFRSPCWPLISHWRICRSAGGNPPEQGTLRGMIERSHFAMAQQDVRYYLNGLLAGSEFRRAAGGRH
ncbi:MAG: hypothetical protein IPN66_08420 [Candidatus Competibacteraceae bacterium]|nr:hypothetical protein [Candidatus Competibacteraceae bacterium]